MGCALALGVAFPAQADEVGAMQRAPQGIELRTASGVLTLEPRSDSIVHVRFGPAGYAGNYNPAVIAKPEAVRFTVHETPDAYVLATPKLTVRVDRQTSAVSFADARGRMLLEEAERTIGSGTMDAFRTRTAIYGLGQHQDGLLDYSAGQVLNVDGGFHLRTL